MAGASGFDDDGELAIGSVFGIRQWARDEQGRLKGVHSLTWEDGENIAICESAKHTPPYSLSPARAAQLKIKRDDLKRLWEQDKDDEAYKAWQKLDAELNDPGFRDCGCGFWAYWDFNPHEFHLGEKPVVGVIEGYGKTIIGKRGFRCEKARIVALHCAYEYVREIPGGAKKPAPATGQPGWQSVFSADYEQNTPGAIARLAQDETELEVSYPSAKVFSTLDAMLKSFPPTKGYGGT